jgi:hypothetical protein
VRLFFDLEKIANLLAPSGCGFSQTGAFIETNEPYPIGQTIRVNYFDPFYRKPYKFIAEVIWSGSFAIGVKFLETF